MSVLCTLFCLDHENEQVFGRKYYAFVRKDQGNPFLKALKYLNNSNIKISLDSQWMTNHI